MSAFPTRRSEPPPALLLAVARVHARDARQLTANLDRAIDALESRQ